MNCIEIIEVRLSKNINNTLESVIGEVVSEIMEKESGFGIRFYKQVLMSVDYMLVIFHSESITDRKGSKTGQLLQEALKEFGMVHQSLWNELEPVESNNQTTK